MKIILLFALWFVCAPVNAQELDKFNTSNSNDVVDIVAEVLHGSSVKYNLISIDSGQNCRQCIQFNFADSSRDLNIFFWKPKGAVVTWRLNQIKGSLITLFPFWKRYFEHDADWKKIMASGNGQTNFVTITGMECVASLHQERNVWMMNIERK